ncbi:two-component system heavy metal sensor histidine kinase CusS [Onishia taeanensis]|uniref:Sensor protein n=1 Tax=Onishia taeanensis TaxID=284577 RepID=A0A328XKY4_9GAMM|nr:heavy metal sensor histidine kinase [Halomonas taeanensis]RAR60253.1 two-component system heavy metal sensor histidine kinase CusS [Halomonas taeanensis]
MSLPKSLGLRLALMFALISLLLLGGISLYLYQSLVKEIAWRDDRMLHGRLERMESLLDDGESIAALRLRPQLYANMLGNRDSLLWILDAQEKVLIEVNPTKLPLPRLPDTYEARLGNYPGEVRARLAWLDVIQGGKHLTLVAGKLLSERDQMLAAYRLKLWMALGVGALLAFLLGWGISRRGLRPVRRLARRAGAIDARHLHLRLDSDHEVTELRVLSQVLNEMLDRLEEGFAQLSRFSEDLAHEMRTPLSNLLGHTQQVLRQERPEEDYQQLLASHIEEYERLSRMINSMLFLARTESPSTTMAREKVNLGELVEQLCDYFEGMAEDDGRKLLHQAQGIAWVNPELLRRALANLIANALHYGRSGTPIQIVATVAKEWVEIGVHNKGQPILPADQSRIFERFYRCDASRSKGGDTGGLGLAIVRSIALWHGGDVQVKSDAENTTFSMILPVFR